MGHTDGESRKQITFDLQQKALKQYYPKPKRSLNPQFYKKAYKDISAFMGANGFEHRQYSVYTSNERLDTYDIVELMEMLAEEMPWLGKCAKEVDVTDIGDMQHSIKDLLFVERQDRFAVTAQEDEVKSGHVLSAPGRTPETDKK